MPLDDYVRKRDFAKSPEPRGAAAGRRRERQEESRVFCVHKHLSSHLHYDLRLELNGVLLSWAVPKGPSLDPTIKRLAMQVEDHPIEYGDFEGVIPEGYGAGLVMLWDRGTWAPEVPDAEDALRKGDLKFTLDGYKLKGSWVLVRTRGMGARGGRSGAGGAGRPSSADAARSWLLIKHRDDWSGELDITTFAPRSVKSGGDFEDILAEDTPAIWQSNRPAKSGEAGALLNQIIERAARLKAEREGRPRDQRQDSQRTTRRTRKSKGS